MKENESGWGIMNIGIIGGGAIGLLISSYLASRHRTTIYVRREQQKNKLNREGILHDSSSKPVKVRALLGTELKKEDCYIVCVKQAHIPTIIPMLAMIDAQTPVVFLQNGMGHLDLITTKQPILVGVVDHGALKINDHTVTHKGKGTIRLAAYAKAEKQLKGLVDAFHQPNFPVYIEKEWSQLLAGKLIVNTVINPVTAVFDIKNGEILHNRYIHTLAKSLCEEAALILELDFRDQWKYIQQVAEKTAQNTSSMLKDLREHRKTELEAITGYLIGKNKHHSIPNTLFIYNSVKALELKKGITE